MPEMLTSVWEGSDNELIPILIKLHLPNVDNPKIVDVTWGGGRFWKNTEYSPIGIDIEPDRAKTIRADNRYLPFRESVFDVVVYDPPFINRKGKKEDSLMGKLYTTVQSHTDICDIAFEFLPGAHAVLKNNGLLIMKLADQTHSGKFWPQTAKIIVESLRYFEIESIIVKTRPNVGPQPHKTQKRAWNRHSYFVIARKIRR